MGKRGFGKFIKTNCADRLIGAIFVAVGTLSGVTTAHAQGACRADTLWVRGDWGQARFSVEVADTYSERSLGLMMRDSLPSGAGMIFIYDETGPASFWMQNTLIPLDMLFADEKGVIQRIHHEAVPMDTTSIFGGDSVRYVLEINGGLAKAMGITVGSEMQHPGFLQEIANWPC